MTKNIWVLIAFTPTLYMFAPSASATQTVKVTSEKMRGYLQGDENIEKCLLKWQGDGLQIERPPDHWNQPGTRMTLFFPSNAVSETKGGTTQLTFSRSHFYPRTGRYETVTVTIEVRNGKVSSANGSTVDYGILTMEELVCD